MVIDGEIPSITLPVSWFFPPAQILWLLSGFVERLGSLWCSSCSISEQSSLFLQSFFFVQCVAGWSPALRWSFWVLLKHKY